MPNDKQINALFERGNNFIRMGNLSAAINDYNQVISAKPDFAPAYFNRGFARQHGRNDLPGAIEDYNESIRLNPDFVDAYVNRAIAYRQQNDLTAALNDYTEAIKRDPKHAQAYCNRGEVNFLRSHYGAALADFTQASALKIDYQYAIAGQAICYHAVGEVDAAYSVWQSLLNKEDQFGDADWVRVELNWADALVAEARRLIDGMGKANNQHG